MIGQIQTELPIWLALIGLVLAIFLSWLSYSGKAARTYFSKFLRILLGILRGTGFFLIFLLLMGLFIKSGMKIRQKPDYLILTDNSLSMAFTRDEDSLSNALNGMIDQFTEILDAEFRVQPYLLGRQLSSGSPDLKDPVTNFSMAVQNLSVQNEVEAAEGILILTDGIRTSGSSLEEALSRLPVKVSFMAFGDTLEGKDARIVEINGNNVVYLNTLFPVDVVVHTEDKNQSDLKLTVSKNEKPYSDTIVEIDPFDGTGRVRLNLEADETGTVTWQFMLESEQPERNPYNNSMFLVTEVVEEKSKLLLVYDQPHPDIRVFREIISRSDLLEIDVWPLSSGYPAIDDYSLIILYQLPGRISDNQFVNDLVDKEINLLFVIGPENSMRFLVDNDILQAEGERDLNEDYGAHLNPSFNLFNVPDNLADYLKVLPPLRAPLANLVIPEPAKVLLRQSIKGIQLDDPLVWFVSDVKRKTGFWMGEGLWRWSSYEYLNFDNHYYTDALLNSLINYLMVNDLEDPLKIEVPSLLSAFEPIRWKGRIYNKSHELTTEPELSMEITTPDGENRNIVFRKMQDEYSFEIKQPVAGRYQYRCQAVIGDQEYTKSGIIEVRDVPFEFMDTRARFSEMRQIAESKGGQFFTEIQQEEVSQYLRSQRSSGKSITSAVRWNSLLEWKMLLFIIVGIFAAEWAMRRYYGTR